METIMVPGGVDLGEPVHLFKVAIGGVSGAFVRYPAGYIGLRTEGGVVNYSPFLGLPDGERLVFGPAPAGAESADPAITVRDGVFYGIVPISEVTRIELSCAVLELTGV